MFVEIILYFHIIKDDFLVYDLTWVSNTCFHATILGSRNCTVRSRIIREESDSSFELLRRENWKTQAAKTITDSGPSSIRPTRSWVSWGLISLPDLPMVEYVPPREGDYHERQADQKI